MQNIHVICIIIHTPRDEGFNFLKGIFLWCKEHISWILSIAKGMLVFFLLKNYNFLLVLTLSPDSCAIGLGVMFIRGEIPFLLCIGEPITPRPPENPLPSA